jgi:hypothetical protein
VLWSVTLQAAGDRVLTHEEIVGLADAVAPSRGVASGIGEAAYGAQLVVEAADRDEAESAGRAIFAEAAATAGLPAWPVASVDAVSEADEAEDWELG